MLHEREVLHRWDGRALALMAVGVLWFLWNLGAAPTRDWRLVWYFAPLALVLLGSELLTTGHVSWQVFLAALVLVGAMILGAVLIFAPAVVSGMAV
jgi:hypothetical protein